MESKHAYWAGGLFDLKELIGNRMLADAFEREAGGRWKAILPQELESNGNRADAIRDDDFEALFASDALIANFDGPDLDSGTVAEFCFAKFLGLPTVLLRTDFRNANDPETCPDPWNLMCSGYPATETVLFSSMRETRGREFVSTTASLARRIVQALERCMTVPPVAKTQDEAFAVFRHAVLTAGGALPERFPDERIRAIVAKRFSALPGQA